MKNILNLIFLLITCTVSGQNPNDCGFALQVCGNSSFDLEPAGVGFDEFSLSSNIAPGCYSFDNNTIWLMFQFDEPGTFTFDLIPDNGVDDYDFAVYGPNVSCTALGTPIRCSSTNPQAAGVGANTGLSIDETDLAEGPGPNGNGYLRFIDVQAEDIFFVLVDRAHGSDGFSVEVTGSAILPEQPIATPVHDVATCDTFGEVDGFSTFDFESLVPEIIGSQSNLSVSFHDNLNDANIGINNLESPYTNVSNPQTIYYRVENNNSQCVDTNDFELDVSFPFEISLPQEIEVCRNLASVSLSTEAGYSYYQWSTGEEGTDLYTIQISEPGEYWVIATDENGCRGFTSTIAGGSEMARINEIKVEDFNDTQNTVTVVVDGIGDYEYSLKEDSNYQDSNVFQGLPNNFYTVFVRDKNGCGYTSERFLVLGYPEFFTPNGDGYNDLWEIIGISNFPGTRIYIFDRYGKLLKDLDPLTGGWDGTFGGEKMPNSDYWFTLEMEDGRIIKGNFSLRR